MTLKIVHKLITLLFMRLSWWQWVGAQASRTTPHDNLHRGASFHPTPVIMFWVGIMFGERTAYITRSFATKWYNAQFVFARVSLCWWRFHLTRCSSRTMRGHKLHLGLSIAWIDSEYFSCSLPCSIWLCHSTCVSSRWMSIISDYITPPVHAVDELRAALDAAYLGIARRPE